MAESAKNATGGNVHDLLSLFSSPKEDFLIRNNGEQVTIASLKGKKLGLYFSAAWCGVCQIFTPYLVEMYNEFSSKIPFEIVYVSYDSNMKSFEEFFSKMPWLAVPFTHLETSNRLHEVLNVWHIPTFVILDEERKVVNANGVEAIRCYGVDANRFTPERVKEINEEQERGRREQTLKSLLVSDSRNFLISPYGVTVLVSELKANTIGLLFSLSSYHRREEFVSRLEEVYEKLEEKGEDFEVVVISLETNEEAFNQDFMTMLWLAIPFDETNSSELDRHFKISTIPTLVILGPDGKILNLNAAKAVEEYGADAYPFTPKRLEELKEIDKARETQTLESLLVSGDLNYVLGNQGRDEILVSDLVGKNILLYFAADLCQWGGRFTEQLVQEYKKLKARGKSFELILISTEHEEASFYEHYITEMPWLVLPFDDPRKHFLSRKFNVLSIPKLVVLGPTGATITTEAKKLVRVYGADGYPFTEKHIKETEAKYEEMAKNWVKKVAYTLHDEDELELTRRRSYVCYECGKKGEIWSFHCDDCYMDLHPECALPVNNED